MGDPVVLAKQVFEGACSAERMRRLIKKQGHVAGRPLWTHEEDEILRTSYPNYKLAMKRLRRRTYYGIRGRAETLGIQRKRHIWKASEISLLRKLYTRASSTPEIRTAFPFVSWEAIAGAARHYGIRRARRPLKGTPFPILNSIRLRCHALGYSMVDLDAVARTGTYFQKAQWCGRQTISRTCVYRAIEALGGTISINWGE